MLEEIDEQNATNHDKNSSASIDIKIASILIESPSTTDQEIADKVGTSRQTVNRRKNSKAVQELVRSTLDIPQKEIRRLASKALSRLEAMLDHEDPRIQLAASISLVKLSSKLITEPSIIPMW